MHISIGLLSLIILSTFTLIGKVEGHFHGAIHVIGKPTHTQNITRMFHPWPDATPRPTEVEIQLSEYTQVILIFQFDC